MVMAMSTFYILFQKVIYKKSYAYSEIFITSLMVNLCARADVWLCTISLTPKWGGFITFTDYEPSLSENNFAWSISSVNTILSWCCRKDSSEAKRIEPKDLLTKTYKFK